MFGERLKALRTERGLSQLELAGMVGITQSMVAQIERSTKQASAPLIAELATVLECTTDSLIYGEATDKKAGTA